jgi:hypothetical protein
VSEVPLCPIDSCEGCPLATINVDGMAKYMTAFSRACASVPPSFGGGGLNCDVVGPCCRGGKCTAASLCLSPQDTLPACADAGGSCARLPTRCNSWLKSVRVTALADHRKGWFSATAFLLRKHPFASPSRLWRAPGTTRQPVLP